MLGVALGLAIHFWRDMSEADAGVALLWPFSDHSFMWSHAGYLLVMGLFAATAAVRSRRGAGPPFRSDRRLLSGDAPGPPV